MSTQKHCRKGPFLAYDQNGHLVSTIYMVPLKDMDAQKNFPGTGIARRQCRSRHPQPTTPAIQASKAPHYHIILWHVPKSEEMAIAKVGAVAVTADHSSQRKRT